MLLMRLPWLFDFFAGFLYARAPMDGFQTLGDPFLSSPLFPR